jgi:hypothetical protein
VCCQAVPARLKTDLSTLGHEGRWVSASLGEGGTSPYNLAAGQADREPAGAGSLLALDKSAEGIGSGEIRHVDDTKLALEFFQLPGNFNNVPDWTGRRRTWPFPLTGRAVNRSLPVIW